MRHQLASLLSSEGNKIIRSSLKIKRDRDCLLKLQVAIESPKKSHAVGKSNPQSGASVWGTVLSWIMATSHATSTVDLYINLILCCRENFLCGRTQGNIDKLESFKKDIRTMLQMAVSGGNLKFHILVSLQQKLAYDLTLVTQWLNRGP
ncbi:hypothetical protein RRG08_009131 [Elysia crispata]|uniref:Uncharacterized protein n=1 Tax=Elysia crispata TaxID=231223 RepID=A0AAE0YP68_9GAST|nr:hypothetical protein RRG08_009131 [Elysia crispata]